MLVAAVKDGEVVPDHGHVGFEVQPASSPARLQLIVELQRFLVVGGGLFRGALVAESLGEREKDAGVVRLKRGCLAIGGDGAGEVAGLILLRSRLRKASGLGILRGQGARRSPGDADETAINE